MAPTQRPILPTPPELVTAGRFNLGTFKAPFRRVNALDAAVAWHGVPLPRPLRRMRLKEWQHIIVVHEDIFLTVTLFDGKVLGQVSVAAYDRRSGQMTVHERKLPPGRPRLPDELFDGRAEGGARGVRAAIRNHLDGHLHRLTFEAKHTRKQPGLSGEITLRADPAEVDPLVVCLPFDATRAVYSHKALLPAFGRVRIGHVDLPLEEGTAVGLLDVHKGYYPRRTRWRWATAGGRDAGGRLTGFNLTDNQIIQQDRYNENVVWVDGRLHALPPVSFEGISRDPSKPWRVRDVGGRVDITFWPDAVRKVDVEVGIMATRYTAPCGTFRGRLRPADAEEVAIEGLYGMAEDMKMRA